MLPLAILLWFCSVLSFVTHFSVSSLCLTLSICFYVLGKSDTSPALESSGLMKKRSYNALQCNVPCSPEPGVACSLLLWLSRFCFYPIIFSGSLCLLWEGFGPCAISGSVWGHFGLELRQASLLYLLRAVSFRTGTQFLLPIPAFPGYCWFLKSQMVSPADWKNSQNSAPLVFKAKYYGDSSLPRGLPGMKACFSSFSIPMASFLPLDPV